MKTRSLLHVALTAALGLGFTGCGLAPEECLPFEDLRVDDEAVAEEAVKRHVARGEAAIPELRDALEDGDARVRHRARTALGRITGQWGWDDGILWKRSVDEAANEERPLLVLHLFGEFDEEFC